jgi:ABC-2 type transport system ATP-binding protein
MNVEKKLKVKRIIKIVLLLAAPLIIMQIINTPTTYIVKSEVNKYNRQMEKFIDYHKHPESGLFIAPTFEANYYALYDGYYNRTSTDQGPQDLDFMIDYFLKKQNIFVDGGFSDVGGVSSMETTYQGIKIIEKLAAKNLDALATFTEDRKSKLLSFMNNCRNDGDFGFRATQLPSKAVSFGDFFYSGSQYMNETQMVIQQQSDILSTHWGLDVAHRYFPELVQNATNMSLFIESCYRDLWVLGAGYAPNNYTLIPDVKSTYHAYNALYFLNQTYPALNLTVSEYRKNQTKVFFDLHYDPSNGGYAAFPGNRSDVFSTFYVVQVSKLLGIELKNETQTIEFAKKCQNYDGGFTSNEVDLSLNLTLTERSMSTMSNAYAVINILTLLNSSLDQTVLDNYLAWKKVYRSKSGLFGYITLDAQYFGVQAILISDPNALSKENKIAGQNITDFILSCYHEDGGYGTVPEGPSNLYATFCAIQTISSLTPQTKYELTTAKSTGEYIQKLQNNETDWGYRMGNSSLPITELQLLQSFELSLIWNMLDKNLSTTIATYWAVATLTQLQTSKFLDRRDYMNVSGAIQFIQNNQAPDGGFSGIRSYRSEIISTYYAVLALNLLGGSVPSNTALLEFVKGAQTSSGSFMLSPLIAKYIPFYPYLSLSYFGWKILNLQMELPAKIIEGVAFLYFCMDFKVSETAGFGDLPQFGADLRNGIMAADIIKFASELYLLNPLPYQKFFDTILFLELLFIIFWIIGSIFVAMKNKIVGLADKFTEQKNYLAKFPAIEVEDLTVYAGKKVIINKMSLRLEQGEILGVLGESGAGKSTFVKALLGMRSFTGKNKVLGFDVKKEAKKLKAYYGYVPQDLSKIYENFTVMENIIVFGQQYGLSVEEAVKRGKLILKGLQIAQKEDELVKNLSGGQKRRASIAISMVHEPPLLILDEPTSGLDPVVREELWLSLVELNQRLKTTLIVITHYPEESRFCNKVAIFGRKKGLIDFGKPSDLLALLPGGGRAIEIIFEKQIENAVQKLSTIPNVDKVLEKNLGKEFVIFTEMNSQQLKTEIQTKIPEAIIAEISQTDARMEDFFRYRFLEVKT